ncbi:dolichyl-diphosphooligosaccharide--protein glycosyltransferase 48 kDa subunit [Helianthus annuus]|nr:dolichyl-diphosphooligosaccharide--protein glycosyltransferase 48 kDa subunit [Helianthus annuus]
MRGLFTKIHICLTSQSSKSQHCSVPIQTSRTLKMAKISIATVFIALISLLLTLTHSFSTENPTDRRILVLLDDLALKSSHSIFFNSLQSRGFELDFKLSDDPKIALQRYGQYLYDGLILFSPTTERFGGSLDVAAVLDFVDSGKDLIVAADASASDLIRSIAAECGVDFDEDPSAVVIDHGSYAVSGTEGDHTLIAADDFIKSDVLLGSTKIEAPVLFKGIGHSLNPANSLVLKVLSASPSAYSANPKSKLSTPPSLSGSSISLVSVVQARNNARAVFSGSLDLFSNKFFKSPVQKAGSSNKYAKSGNEQFVTELSKWVFHERGHLKAVNVKHHRVGETDEPAIYRINDDLEYSVEIYEWSGSSWEPYVANDVQVQFYMMSPYVLKTMSTDKKGLYHASFKVPDVYGVFQFKVEYQRLGYTSLSLAKQIPVRPFRHNEYERFIPTAFPYYGASFSTMAAFFIFSFVYLYSK